MHYRAVDATQHWVGKALSPSNGRWLKRALGAALKRDRSKVYAPARKDINEDFPLRGFVACDDCGEPMTSCWSKGRNKHDAYYLCDTPKRASKSEFIPRAEIEDGAEAVLQTLQPARPLVEMARAML